METTIAEARRTGLAIDITEAERELIAAARALADLYRLAPHWEERLRHPARRLVEAVDALNEAEAAR